MRYLPHCEDEIATMLATAGASSLDDLFQSIPKELQLSRPLALPPALDEQSLWQYLSECAGRNSISPPFLGAGAYPHYIPAAVDQILLRSEWYTAYTPYQPEISQGTLQAIFEFQTYVSLLTGLEVANASLYDGATATAEAALLCHRLQPKRCAIVVSRALHPAYRQVLRTYLRAFAIEIREVPFGANGQTDLPAVQQALEGAAGLIVGYPNFFGIVEPIRELAQLCQQSGALCVTATSESLALGLLASPGSLGAQIAVGEMQSFGNSLSFGGPGLGFMATQESMLRQIPGRLVGATVDRQGRRSFVLTLATREQHIKREKATSNICTNNSLCALAATIHLSLLGKHGLHELAKLNWQRARYARKQLQNAGLTLPFTAPVFNEFVLQGPIPAIQQKLSVAGIEGGYRLDKDYPELDGLLFCVTEVHSPEMIDRLVSAIS